MTNEDVTTRMLAVLVLGLGLVVACSGDDKTAGPDAPAPDAAVVLDTRALSDTTPDTRASGDTPIPPNDGDAADTRAPDVATAPDTGGRETKEWPGPYLKGR